MIFMAIGWQRTKAYLANIVVMKGVQSTHSTIFIKPVKIMPRLVGKNSYAPLYTTVGILSLALGGAIALEYLGVIDVVPGFGQGSSIVIEKATTERPIPPQMK